MSEAKPTTYERQLLRKINNLEAQVSKLDNHKSRSKKNKIVDFFRSFAVIFCIVLCAVMLNIGVISIWLKRTVINTSIWTDKTSQLLQSESIKTTIADKITDEVFTAANAEQVVSESLPPRISGLASPLTNSLRGFTSQKVTEALGSAAFQSYWSDLNQSAHGGIIASLENGGQAPSDTSKYVVYINDNQLLLNLQPVFTKVQSQLSNRGLSFVDSINPSRLNKTITITEIQSLPKTLQIFNLINKGARVIPVIGIIGGAVAVLLARNRRRVIIAISVMTAALMSITVQVINFARYPLLQKATDSSSTISTQAASDTFSILTNDLVLYCRIMMVIALIIGITAWLTGNSRVAIGLRMFIAKLLSPKNYGKTFSWLAMHATTLVALTAILAGLLVIFPPISGPTFVIVVILIASIFSLWLLSIRTAGATKTRP